MRPPIASDEFEKLCRRTTQLTEREGYEMDKYLGLIDDIKKGVEIEISLVFEYTQQIKFPTFKEAAERILKSKHRLAMMIWAEFGEPNYEWLKTIYESGFDKKVTKEMGEYIYQRGGMQAMQMNFYAMMLVSPTSQANVTCIRFAYKSLEWYWDGIGQWRA